MSLLFLLFFPLIFIFAGWTVYHQTSERVTYKSSSKPRTRFLSGPVSLSICLYLFFSISPHSFPSSLYLPGSLFYQPRFLFQCNPVDLLFHPPHRPPHLMYMTHFSFPTTRTQRPLSLCSLSFCFLTTRGYPSHAHTMLVLKTDITKSAEYVANRGSTTIAPNRICFLFIFKHFSVGTLCSWRLSLCV